MRMIQIKRIFFYLISFSFLYCYCPAEADFTLADILNADSEVQNQKPSLTISRGLIGKEITIKEESYQIRFFNFEARPIDNVKELTFLQFVKQHNLQNMLASKDIPHLPPPVHSRASLYPTYSLFKNLEEGGVLFHFMIVLGKNKDRS